MNASIYFTDGFSHGFPAYWKIATPGILAQRSELVALITLLEYTLAEHVNILCDSALCN